MTVAGLNPLSDRARIWTIGSDPGSLRFRVAARSTIALGSSLLVLFVLARLAGQPLTVAPLAAVITMIAARSVDEPDPRQQRITMALLPVPTALSAAAAAVLAPHLLASDVVFVVIVAAAVYVRRYGPRWRAFGMVAFMAYFFTLYLRAGLRELPWMFAAVLVGTVCTYVITVYVLPDRPESVLRGTIRSLRARMAIAVDTTADALRAGRVDERRLRRIRRRVGRLNETALLVQSQIEDKANPATLWPGLGDEQLTPWLFDAELAVEWVAIAGVRAVERATEIPSATRAELIATLNRLAVAIRTPHPDWLDDVASRAQQIADQQAPCAPTESGGAESGRAESGRAESGGEESGAAGARRLALAIVAAAKATAAVGTLIEHAAAGGAPPARDDEPAEPHPDGGTGDIVGTGDIGGSPRAGMLPTTRQAIQVAVAAALAIVSGNMVSPDRWYWAVIAAFLVFAGTNTWGETLTKGWQRLLGTVLGVPAGMLVASVVAGNRVTSVVMIFVCLFCVFYFMQIAQSLMTFWITTMLALLYGLLGQFSLEVLVVRIEETAIGAVIGVVVAILVLPTTIGKTIRNDTREFLTALSTLIETSIATLFDADQPDKPTEQARQLDRKLQQYRVTAQPMLVGVTGLAGRRTIRSSLRLLAACDRYARMLARRSEQCRDPESPRELAEAVTEAAAQIRHNIDTLVGTLQGVHTAKIVSATDALDAAEALATEHDASAVLHPLRQIDHLVVATASHLDSGAVLRVPATPS